MAVRCLLLSFLEDRGDALSQQFDIYFLDTGRIEGGADGELSVTFFDGAFPVSKGSLLGESEADDVAQ